MAVDGHRLGPPALLAEVERNGVVESRHRGHVAVLDARGRLTGVGDVGSPLFPRSTAKPLQAVAMLRAGLDLDGELLAVAAASHSGEPGHIERVAAILARAGLDERDLRCPPRDGRRIRHNCSGKHAAMLATCVRNGWDTASYRWPDHPLQQHVRATMSELADHRLGPVGVDGCGAPVFALPLGALARAIARLLSSPAGSPERKVADAMRAHPWLAGGTGRAVTRLMESVPGLLAKDGAEAVWVAGLPAGPVVAMKIDDGGERAAPAVLYAAVTCLGAELPGVPDDLRAPAVLGGGEPVGAIRVVAFSGPATRPLGATGSG